MDSRVKIMKALQQRLQRVNVDRWRMYAKVNFILHLQIGVFYSLLKHQLDHLE